MPVTTFVGRFLSDDQKQAIRDLQERLKFGRLRLHHVRASGNPVRANRRILFHPRLPMHEHIVLKMVAVVGDGVTQRTSGGFDVVVRFEDDTWLESDPTLERLAQTHRIINGRCDDISKSRVNEVFAKAFGYELGVDPTTHEGVAVAKSEVNALHDGREVTCPTTREPGVSYQRLVDSRTEDGMHTVVFRVPVVGDQIPLVFRKLRPAERHLTDADVDAVQLPTDEVLSAEEQAQILQFCALLGLDVGEIDVLRDNGDGRIYIVDANATPWGPPEPMLFDGREPGVLADLAPAYEALFERFRGPAASS